MNHKASSIFLSLLLLAATARAQDPKAAARIHFDKGQREYDLGNFAASAKEFEDAYRLFPRAEFLFNLGQAHRKLGSNERALFFYRGYLRNLPSAPNRAEVEQWIAELEKPQPGPEPAPVASPAPSEPVIIQVSETPGPPDDRSGLRRTGYLTLGVSGAVLGAGVVFGFMAKSKSDKLEEEGANGANWESSDGLVSNGENLEKAQIVCLIAGGAGAVAGAVMVYLGWPTGPAQVAVGPSTVMFSGSF